MDENRSRRRIAANLLVTAAFGTYMVFVWGPTGLLWLLAVLGMCLVLSLPTMPGGDRRVLTTSRGRRSDEPGTSGNQVVSTAQRAAEEHSSSTALGAGLGTAIQRLTGRMIALAAILLLLWMYLDDLGNNPIGLFCDEAEIGLHTYQLVSHLFDDYRPSFFYQHFEYTNDGTLPLVASAPVVWLLGLSDLSIRLVSVIWSVAAIVVLVALVRRLGWRNGEVAVLMFASAPIFIHLSRVNFGHAPSMFCVCLGLYAYARAREGGWVGWSLLCGFVMGLSVYGYPGYYFATPVIVVGLGVGEIVSSKLTWRAYRALVAALVTMAIVWMPIVIKVFTDEQFLQRYREKRVDGASLLSLDRLQMALNGYPKYFDFGYLFTHGETGGISRHSVAGAGLFSVITIPFIVLGVVAIVRSSRGAGRMFAVSGLAILVLYPLPDLVTTSARNPPYTLAVFPSMIFVPLLVGYGMHQASGWVRERWGRFGSAWVLPVLLTLVVLAGAMRFYTGPYAQYPEVSAGYYGWQFGPRRAIEAFEARAYDYDRYVLDPHFNKAFIFPDFYLVDNPELRDRTFIGSTELVDWNQNTLFAIRAERFDRIMGSGDPLRRYVHVIDVVQYPNGANALYLVEIGLEHQRPRTTPW